MNEIDYVYLGALPNFVLKEENYEKADVIIINTCAIRENAQNKVVGILGRIKKLKETNPNIITIIGGCMPQEESVSNMIKDKYKM